LEKDMAVPEGLRKTDFGLFFVLATLGSLGGLIGRLVPKIACRQFCRTRVRNTDPAPPFPAVS
jgi:hypothetical protein